MKRRRFLVSAGGLLVGLPLLRKFADAGDVHASGPAVAPQRVIVMTYEMGTHLAMWTPSGTGSQFTLGPITAPVEPFVDRCCLVSNTDHSVLGLGGDAYVYGHPAKKEAALTGTLLQSSFTGDGSNHVDNVIVSIPEEIGLNPNGPSVETVIGASLAKPSHMRASIDLGIWGSGGVRDAVPSSFFYEGAANPVTINCNPGLAFASVFNGVMPDTGELDPEFAALLQRRKSVLDAVRDSFVDLRQGLGAQDRATLDEHADKIRQIELDMPALISCSLPTDIPGNGSSAYDSMTMMELGDLQNRIMAQAMGCGIAPVGRIEYTDQQLPKFGIPLVDDTVATVQDWHHPIVHAVEGWAPDHPARVAGFTFFVQKFADLLGHLDSIVEGADGETALDNSLVVLASDFGEGGGHASFDLCFLIAGGTGPGVRGFHLDGSPYSANDVLNTLIQMACVTNEDGSPVAEFGLPGFGAGPISALLV